MHHALRMLLRIVLPILLTCLFSPPGARSSSLNLADVPCGKIARGSRRFHQRIMGGSKIHITEFPHTVSLRKNGVHFCGGALIHKQYVVTAAHCLHSYPAKVWTVAVGEQSVTVEDKEHEQLIAVDEILKHPDYQYPKFLHDLALIRLKKPVVWSKWAQPVCLPDKGQRTGRGLGYLAGWGFDNERRKGGAPTEDLMMAKLPIMENGQCEEWFRSQGKKITVRPEQLCAGHEKGQEDGCQGDSGGGLVALDDNKLVLVGVMSAGIGCGRERLPGVYTRMEKFVNWVEKEVGLGADDDDDDGPKGRSLFNSYSYEKEREEEKRRGQYQRHRGRHSDRYSSY